MSALYRSTGRTRTVTLSSGANLNESFSRARADHPWIWGTPCKTVPRAGTVFWSISLKFGGKVANRSRNNTVPPFGPYSLGSPILAPSKNDVFQAISTRISKEGCSGFAKGSSRFIFQFWKQWSHFRERILNRWKVRFWFFRTILRPEQSIAKSEKASQKKWIKIL